MGAPETIGRFEIRRVLGRGAMGVVYLAEDPVLGRPVAIKTIEIAASVSDEQVAPARKRFESEARAAAGLSHPSLVTVYDAGGEGDCLYIAMEYIDGRTLDAVIARQLPSTREASELVAHLASGLDYAHERGVVHRDIKPANVLVDDRGVAKITDFGVARQATSTLTATGTIIGTPAYMSPEQVLGQTVTGASDQFSLAIVTYELLTGERPFAGEDTSAILYEIVHSAPAPPSSLRPELPPAIDAVVLRGMSKSPADRFPSCEELAEAAARALAGDLRSRPSEGSALAQAQEADESGAVAEDTGEAKEPGVEVPIGADTAAGLETVLDPAARTGIMTEVIAEPFMPPRRRSWRWVVLLLAVAAAGIWWSGPDSVRSLVTGTAPETELPVSAALAPTVETSYTIISQPPGAEVFLDGVLRGGTPVMVALRPEVAYTLRVFHGDYEAVDWGFVPSQLPTELQDQGEIYFGLTPLGPEQVPESAPNPEGIGEEIAALAPVPIDSDIVAPALSVGSPPVYPAWAIERGLPDHVIVRAVVDREGRVREIKSLQAGVDAELLTVATEAMRGWIYTPARRGDVAVDVYFNLMVTFVPADGE